MAARLLNNTLKVQRAIKNWTQEQLAQEVGVTRKTINSIENAKDVPSTFLALKMAKVFEVTVEDLFQLAEDQIWGKSPFE